MTINWRRGLFRLWVLMSAFWVLGVVAVERPDLQFAKALNPDRYGLAFKMPNGNTLTFPATAGLDRSGVIEATKAWAAQHRSRLQASQTAWSYWEELAPAPTGPWAKYPRAPTGFQVTGPTAFHVTAPDGKEYRVTGPEGATEQQALEYVQSQLKREPMAEIPKPPPGFTLDAAVPPPGSLAGTALKSERLEFLAEEYRRGALSPDMKAAYEEAMRRGILPSAPSRADAGVDVHVAATDVAQIVDAAIAAKSSEARSALIQFALFALAPPALLFCLGSVLMWVGAGFRCARRPPPAAS